MNHAPSIRPARAEDAHAITALRDRTIRTVVAPLGLYTPEQIDQWAGTFSPELSAAVIAEGNSYVSEIENHVVGFGRLQVSDAGVLHIRGIFVDADFIHRGLGRQMVEYLLALAQSRGERAVELIATLNARGFYERLGFQCLARVMHTTRSGAIIPGFHMRIVLGGQTGAAAS